VIALRPAITLSPEDWAAAERRFPPRLPLDETFLARPLLSSIGAMAERYPSQRAVIDDHGTITYAALMEAIDGVSRRLASSGAAEGPVAVLLRADIASIAALFGCLAAQRPCVILDAGLPAERLGALMAGAGAPISLSTVSGSIEIKVHRSAEPSPTRSVLGPDDPAVILPTSGSTGQPRLIVHSQRTLANRTFVRIHGARLSVADRVLSAGAIAAFGTLAHVLSTLCAGATLRLLDLRAVGLGGLLTALADDRISVLRGGVSILRALAEADRARVRSATRMVRIVWLGGELVTAEDVAGSRDMFPPDTEVVVGYGSTECISFRQIIARDDTNGSGVVPVGYPDTGASAVLLDEDGTIVESGAVGELVVRSRYNALGEWENGALTHGRLRPDPADPDCRVYFTGDLARQLPDGRFVILGRRDRMLKIAGQRIEPAEIERALMSLDGVTDAIVLPLERAESRILVGFVVAPRDMIRNGHPSAWRSRLRDVLPSHMVPARVVALEAFPRLAAGKIDAEALLRAMR
jgi:acyl-coenzyme A synthetase/AMP-(fatty) acid ligase